MDFNEALGVAKDLAATDTHVPTALGNARGRRPGKMFRAFLGGGRKHDWSLGIPILKSDAETRTVYGWASVAEEGGAVVTDAEGDRIAIAELVAAAHDFMSRSRRAGEGHAAIGIGEVVESVVFTPELQQALGVDLGKSGWFIAMKIADDAVWQRVKDGSLRAFSIGGAARREAIPEEE